MRAEIFGPAIAIGELIRRPAVRVDAASTLSEVALAMRRENVSAVLVAGASDDAIATERDLARALAAGLGPDDPIAMMATTHPIRVPAETPIVQAAAVMLNEEVRHLVIDYRDGSEAVVSFREVIAVLLQAATPHLWLETLRIALPHTREL